MDTGLDVEAERDWGIEVQRKRRADKTANLSPDLIVVETHNA
jgi:hypothetical protein